MLTTFIAASALICLSPGPSMLVVIKNSIKGGLKKGVASIFGVIIADAFLLFLSMTGLGAIMHSSSVLYALMTYMGAAYLIYMGCSTLLKKEKEQWKQKGSESPFFSALCITLLNPKIIGFFIAFFPQFLDQEVSVGAQLAILGPVFLLIVFFVLIIYAIFANIVKNQFAKESWKRVFKIITGLSLIACGLIAAVKDL